MQELTKVFNDTVLPVEVINEKEFMVDISGIASKYNKSVAKWKETERFKELLNIRERRFKGTLIQTKQGKGGYTKIHNSMLISFARYISAEFEDWCDETIYDILTKSKDDEIRALKEARKLAMIDNEGFASVRAIAQRTEYTEQQIRSFLESLGAIKRTVKDTLYWSKGDTEINGLVRQKGEFGTAYMDFERMVNLLGQEYSSESYE